MRNLSTTWPSETPVLCPAIARTGQKLLSLPVFVLHCGRGILRANLNSERSYVDGEGIAKKVAMGVQGFSALSSVFFPWLQLYLCLWQLRRWAFRP